MRKLLAKAEDPAVTAEEAEPYNAKAAELIARQGSTPRCWPRPAKPATRSGTGSSRWTTPTPGTRRTC